MPLPVDFDTGTVIAKYVDFKGAVLSGSVTFTATEPRLHSQSTGTTIITRPLEVVIDPTGQINVVLPATNDPDIEPVGFQYVVKEDFTGPDRKSFTYSITVPFGATIDLADHSPVFP
jgi:hypothetical protein